MRREELRLEEEKKRRKEAETKEKELWRMLYKTYPSHKQ